MGGLSNLFSLFGGESSIGLSIGTSSIKLIELKKSGKVWKLLHFGMVQLPEDAIVNREIVNPVVVAESLKTLLSQIRLKNKSVCTAVSGNSVIIKRMQIDAPNSKEIESQVFWEAEQYVPFDISEVYLDYQVLGKAPDGKTEVLLVAVKKGIIDSYMGIVQDGGLKPKVIDVDHFALTHLLDILPVAPGEAAALVDIGAASIKMVITQSGVPLFTKDTALGGKNLTQEIQRHMNMSFSDAEVLKLSGQTGGLPQEVGELIAVMNDNFAMEIKRTLDLYSASSSGGPVRYVLLCGGAARTPNLSRIVEEKTGLPVQVINPFSAIAFDSGVFSQEYVQNIAAVASVPVGLAMRARAG